MSITMFLVVAFGAVAVLVFAMMAISPLGVGAVCPGCPPAGVLTRRHRVSTLSGGFGDRPIACAQRSSSRARARAVRVAAAPAALAEARAA
ncbi:hypothetical protein ACFSJD_42725, partial [Pseudonocardia yunnanensis]